MTVSSLLLNLLADCTMKMVILRMHIIHETHRELTGNAKDTATVHLVRTATNKKAQHKRFGKLESKVPNDDSNHTSIRSFYKKPRNLLRGEWPSGPASSISFTEVKHGCVRSETGWATVQMNDQKTAHSAVLRKGR